MKRTLLASLLLLVLPYSVFAEEPAPLPEPPDLPPQVESGEVLEPEVTIRESDKGTIQEYRINGRMYMVKITPVAGPPYYLLDNDGDGEMDVRQEAHPGKVAIPQWVLFSW
ncbi:MAG: DUF2782 domain-containing protein [Sedimenticola sp.]|nr:DUF2782 domain-containing protein [Sedimenticola sp.]